MIRSHNHAQMGGYKLPEALSGSAQAFQCISQYLLKAFRIAVRRSAYIHKLKAEVARGCIAVLPDFARNRWPRSREESLQPDEPFSKSDGRPPWSCMRPPNEKQIRCRPQARATSINDSIAWPRGRPPSEELGPAPACRLHLRVRHQPHAWSPILTEARRTDARVPAWSSRGRGSPHATTFGRGPPAPSDCPRRGRRLRPPHRSGILPTSGDSARTAGDPRRPGAGAANSTQGSRSSTTAMAAAGRSRGAFAPHHTTKLSCSGGA